MSLTVPGRYKNEFLGLYTLVESVDKNFLKDHFNTTKGLLVKPENVGPLEYLGEEWKPYQDRYRPKTDASEKAQKRLVARARAREEVRAAAGLALQRRVKQPLDLFPAFGIHKGVTGTLRSVDDG